MTQKDFLKWPNNLTNSLRGLKISGLNLLVGVKQFFWVSSISWGQIIWGVTNFRGSNFVGLTKQNGEARTPRGGHNAFNSKINTWGAEYDYTTYYKNFL